MNLQINTTVPWRPHDNLGYLHEPPNQHHSPLTTPRQLEPPNQHHSCLHEPPNQHHSPLTTPRQLELSTWTSKSTPQSPDDPTATWAVYMNLQINTIIPWRPHDNLGSLHERPNQHHSPLTTPRQLELSTWTSKSTSQSPEDPTTTWAVYMNVQINTVVPWRAHDHLSCLHEPPNQHHSLLTTPRQLELSTWTSKSTPQSPDDPTTI